MLLRNFTNEDDPASVALRTRMDRFYQTTPDYVAFQSTNELPDQWNHVRAAIFSRLEQQPTCRILEIGCGRTGFSDFVKDIRSSIHYTAQDVTRTNEAHLREVADTVHFGSISELKGEFDVIFSTFAFEHISDPRQTLEKLFGMLTKNGKLFLFCPRYDMPFYISHSADHYGLAKRLGISVLLLMARVWALLTRKPLFLIHTDPAVFHLPLSRDRDAIHWVSLWDLRMFFRNRGIVSKLPLPSGGVKDWIVKKLLQVNVVITRAE